METIYLYSSKKKAVLMLIGCMAFIAAGTWMLSDTESISTRYPAFLIDILACVCIAFFGIGALMAVKVLFNKKPALIIDRDGLVIKPSQLGMAVISWNDITLFSEYNVGRQKFVSIQLNNTSDYINKETSNFKRRLMQANTNMYGSPFALSATLYTLNHNQLLALLRQSLARAQYPT
jgi:hypothetical protein